jgi:hypothetical protein
MNKSQFLRTNINMSSCLAKGDRLALPAEGASRIWDTTTSVWRPTCLINSSSAEIMYLSPIGPTEIYPKKRRRLPSKPTARSSGTMSAEKTSSPFRHCGLKTTNAHNPQALPGSDASGRKRSQLTIGWNWRVLTSFDTSVFDKLHAIQSFFQIQSVSFVYIYQILLISIVIYRRI